ncbi:hypothetical protein [Hymenobacter terrenus]|uniref:hypothetical protein n=1 Tax=Hymenobacter terrenus TaxID=1629124 RepID=UPI0006199A91|nr:hypothetical protein [Hymenobacter terrenus]
MPFPKKPVPVSDRFALLNQGMRPPSQHTSGKATVLHQYSQFGSLLHNPVKQVKQVLCQASLRINGREIINWWSGVDVGYHGSGWGHGLRRLLADQLGLDNTVSNLVELGIHSQLQSSRVRVTGHLLALIIADPAMIRFQNEKIRQIRAHSRYGVYPFTPIILPAVVGFGGDRTGGDNWNKLSRENPILHKSTWQVATNELTWSLRNVMVHCTASVDSRGTITLNYWLRDTFDLSEQKGRSGAYNAISRSTGFLYHDVVGGNSELQVEARWTQVITPRRP